MRFGDMACVLLGFLVALSPEALSAGAAFTPSAVTIARSGLYQDAAESADAVVGPSAHVYSRPGGTELSAHVYRPADDGDRQGPRAAILVFHGGGWSLGEAAWAFPQAQFFAERGMVGIAVQYRLSDQESITPIEAMADARAAFRWVRTEAGSLGIDPDRVAGYGWSAGAHLIASAAVFDDLSPESEGRAAPDAMVLMSPAVSVDGDGWFQRLLGERADADALSPHLHVRAGLPPTLILQGDVDTVTPLPGVTYFCEAMRAHDNVCDMKLYRGYGHLFTPAGIPDGDWPQSDPETRAAAREEAAVFLRKLGFIDNAGAH